MTRGTLARQLLSVSTEAERRSLIKTNRQIADTTLAREIREQCYAAWTTEPVLARNAASSLKLLAKLDPDPEIAAISTWIKGIAAITRGEFTNAILDLDAAYRALSDLGLAEDAARTLVAKLLSLAMLGRYDEAALTGTEALEVFKASGDELSAGKVEMNLSNISSRQGLLQEARDRCLSARRRFIKAGEKRWQAMAENVLANTYMDLGEFDKAEKFYTHALTSVRDEKMLVTEAEIEASLGNLAMLRGRYPQALRYLELSREKYDELEMPHQSAVADMEMADIYVELNLLSEANDIYERVGPVFMKLKLRAEEARARLNYGRIAGRLGNEREARRQLKKACRLFELENNESGRVSAMLAETRLALRRRDVALALKILDKASMAMRHDENPRHEVDLNLLKGEALLISGELRSAGNVLKKALDEAEKGRHPNAIQATLNALGKVALRSERHADARRYFRRAADVVESMRSMFGTDEFGMAFFASRIEPFENLARLELSERRIPEAFDAIERGRSQSLLAAMARRKRVSPSSQKLRDKIAEIRAELNFYYKRLESSTGDEFAELKTDIKRAENDLAAALRRSGGLAEGEGTGRAGSDYDRARVQAQLKGRQTLVEYVITDGEIAAFVVTDTSIRFVEGLGRVDSIQQQIDQLHFQFGTFRYGGGIARFAAQLKGRTDQTLGLLYDQLIGPLEGLIGGSRCLVVVPVGPLHYLPFHAFHDGSGYLLERFEVSYAPSAAVWAQLGRRSARDIENSLLIGYADARIPLSEQEIGEVQKVVPHPTTFTGDDATFDTFIGNVGRHDLVHVACHGQFRPDSPMFSSLHLADGWITVRDIVAQRLRARLVTLSACETGVSRIFAGDEILGLARGFLAAGAASLIVSLWRVNDEATGRLMSVFYNNLQLGNPISSSLRGSQLSFIERGEHPFLWSPFVLIGR